MTLELPTASQQACQLTARYISAGRVQAMHTTAGYGLVQGSASGVTIHDVDGRSFIDCRSAGGVFNLGHRHPQIAEVLASAARDVDIGDWMLLSAIRAQTAEQLARLAPGDLDHVQFAVTGGEAIEAACKFARGTTGRQTIVTMDKAYHGFVGFGLAAAPASVNARYVPLTPGVASIAYGDIDAAARAIDGNTAAVLLEAAQGSAGSLLPPAGYLQALRALCDRHGALLIFDEVQAGMGRTGKLFSFENWGVVPDMAVVGKALGGGYYPIAACLYNDRVLAFVDEVPLAHPSTFSGSEIGCLVAAKALELLSTPTLLDNVVAMGERLKQGYQALQSQFPDVVTGCRQLGLFTGIETLSAESGTALRHAAVRHGLLAFTAPFRPGFLAIWPPLVITAAEVDELLRRLGRAVQEASARQ
jgi:acetylornithine/succinyldiaminopimelate/putrescine aminotransferase